MQQVSLPMQKDSRPKWLGSPVNVYEGSFWDIEEHIPIFDRRTLGIPDSKGKCSAINAYQDVIVRKALNSSDVEIPVGVVSKQYVLVQHRDVLRLAMEASEKAGIAIWDSKTEISITEYGERMRLRILFPEKYGFNPGDGHPMALRLECFNSVDGSTKFMAILGWLRFVCSNGMVVGTVRSDVRRRHNPSLNIEDIGAVLEEGITLAEEEKKLYQKWIKMIVRADSLAHWIDGPLKTKWGVKAATRAYHIAQTGHDAVLLKPFEKAPPTERTVEAGRKVPGVPEKTRSLFGISQILSWLAKERREVQEQLDLAREIPELVQALQKPKK